MNKVHADLIAGERAREEFGARVEDIAKILDGADFSNDLIAGLMMEAYYRGRGDMLRGSIEANWNTQVMTKVEA